ncbi:hypothetical protein Glove_230g206 [Diversispora epigaea]|uniref:TLDc domain-containing protein n=1 Tax=Diversispora epigaea TaxID=1348612 RepID=A0A397IK80_9GLOM|nr:hypothetical protein Glove_230g206 [Diversispora epigaea]
MEMITNKSFIFSFKNGNIQNSILSRVKKKNNNRSFWYPHQKDDYGPIFGCDEFAMRLDVSDFTQDGLNWCKNSNYNCYEKSIRTTDDGFSIIDYEVFKVVKKST